MLEISYTYHVEDDREDEQEEEADEEDTLIPDPLGPESGRILDSLLALLPEVRSCAYAIAINATLARVETVVVIAD